MDTEQKQSKKQDNPALKVGITVVVVIVVAALGLYIAVSALNPAPTPIGDILGDMRNYDGKIVTVRGEVTNRVNILDFKAYGVEDETGQIWVVTARGNPNQGETVTVTGIVDEVIALGAGSFTIIKEPDDVD